MARSIGGNVPAPGPARRDFFAQLGTGLHGMALAVERADSGMPTPRSAEGFLVMRSRGGGKKRESW